MGKPVSISSLEIKCDTNLKRNIMMRKDKLENRAFTNKIPKELLKSLEAEARVNGKWVILGRLDKNQKRLIKFRFDKTETTAIRIHLKETYGHNNARLYEVRCYQHA